MSGVCTFHDVFFLSLVENPQNGAEKRGTEHVGDILWSSVQCCEFLCCVVFGLVFSEDDAEDTADDNSDHTDVSDLRDAFVKNELRKQKLRNELDGR